MTDSTPVADLDTYLQILEHYLKTRSEEALYRVSLLSQELIEGGLGPEDIIALHFETLDQVLKGLPARERLLASNEAEQFLLEVMIAYGVRFKEYLELKLRESARDAAAQAALERQRAFDAERLGRQKDEILRIIAHELRTPLTAARGHLDLARRSLSRGQYDPIPGQLEQAREAMDRLSRLSADLVEASRDALPSLRMETHDLARIVRQACAWAGPAAEEGGVKITYPTAPKVFIHADSDGVLSILGNLLSNAIRYTSEGGQVTVGYGKADEWAWLEVRDTGIGMPPEVRARVFEKFYRAPEARQLEASGLGLGLTLVGQVVEAHAGRIEIESAEGQGTTFRVYLPLAKDDTEERANE